MSAPTLPPARLAWTIWGLAALLYLVGFYQRVAPAVMTDALMRDFSLAATGLGNLSAFYFYAYVVMQIPTGLIVDRWGARRLLTVGAVLAAAGQVVFAWAPVLFWANVGRLMIGGAVAVAFVSMLKLASHWLSARQFALASGLALLVGICGGVFAGVPLRLLVDAAGWRPVMAVSGLVTVALAAAIWWRVRDDPSALGYASYHTPSPAHDGSLPSPSIRAGLLAVLRRANLWLILIAAIGVAGAPLTFAGLWGVPYLRQVHGLAATDAAALTSALLIAWAIGGPVLGSWSERMGRRKPLFVAGAVVPMLCWGAVTWFPLPLWAVIAVLLPASFAAGAIIIGFAYAKESVPVHLVGTASGLCNMGPLLGGMLLQPAFGWLLDNHWQGGTAAGIRIYDATAYSAGFMLLFAGTVLSVFVSLLTRETGCRQAQD
jgi:sugar phosphate permease